MTTTDITIYIKAIQFTKQQYEQALSAKLEAENQVRILKQQEKCFKKSVVVAKSKATDKTDVADANIKELKHCLTPQC
jgi:membrane fusion protein (multidrug efflux system)